MMAIARPIPAAGLRFDPTSSSQSMKVYMFGVVTGGFSLRKRNQLRGFGKGIKCSLKVQQQQPPPPSKSSLFGKFLLLTIASTLDFISIILCLQIFGMSLWDHKTHNMDALVGLIVSLYLIVPEISIPGQEEEGEGLTLVFLGDQGVGKTSIITSCTVTSTTVIRFLISPSTLID
ncbi:hypothetical protein IGI04_020584 [Brassica rapa subsp. trilocularis]|uniref:SRP54-type proteins GTP-binding domain-containing protein n=1 Tax=Brassica rapa subsp. trilocularis TaxID=1813537 RepID=A0ABQ7MLI8_BRACM|nr:hypothetical protein IGI04_033733 [Brassica rapa subsp. trilocularis]KAG5398770.1 hypothetical protein IGI04_020584 [Brassica rapa subsp. trilocularis]